MRGEDDDHQPDRLDVFVGFDDGNGYQCNLSTDTNSQWLAEFSVDDSALTVDFEDVPSDCGDIWTVLQVTFYLDTSRHRRHTNQTGQQCRTTSQQDPSPDVGVTLVVQGQGEKVNGEGPNAGYYEIGKTRCHSTGAPGNPQP